MCGIVCIFECTDLIGYGSQIRASVTLDPHLPPKGHERRGYFALMGLVQVLGDTPVPATGEWKGVLGGQSRFSLGPGQQPSQASKGRFGDTWALAELWP